MISWILLTRFIQISFQYNFTTKQSILDMTVYGLAF